MVYFENALSWSSFDHNLKIQGPSCKMDTACTVVYPGIFFGGGGDSTN
jgi:hypothetical protein